MKINSNKDKDNWIDYAGALGMCAPGAFGDNLRQRISVTQEILKIKLNNKFDRQEYSKSKKLIRNFHCVVMDNKI